MILLLLALIVGVPIVLYLGIVLYFIAREVFWLCDDYQQLIARSRE